MMVMIVHIVVFWRITSVDFISSILNCQLFLSPYILCKLVIWKVTEVTFCFLPPAYYLHCACS